MPQWEDRQAVTVKNLLQTFSADVLKKLISGHLKLALSKDATTHIQYMHPCDVEKVDAPRYYAVYTRSKTYLRPDVREQCTFLFLNLSKFGMMGFLQRSSELPKALTVLCHLFADTAYSSHEQYTHYQTERTKFIEDLVQSPQPLIALAGAMVLADEEQQVQFIALLFAIKREMSAEQFAHLITASHAASSVLNALLASERMCALLNEAQFFTVVNIVYTQARQPLSVGYIDRVLSFRSSTMNLNHVFFGAARCGDVAMVRQLLAVRATTRLIDADYVDPTSGELALHCALRASLSDELVHMLVTQTKNLTHCDHRGYSPLALALKLGRMSVVDALLLLPAVKKAAVTSVPMSTPVLHAAVESHDEEMLRKVLAVPGIGDVINCPDLHGDTALSVAVRRGNFDQVQLLMAYGALAHSSNIEGASPQDYAKHNPKMLALLQRSPAEALSIPADKVAPAPSDVELMKAQVISILYGQVESDKAYTVDRPVVRLHLFEAIRNISRADDLPSVHKRLIELQQQQFVKNDGKGEPIAHSFLRQTTIAHLQSYGFLQDIPLSGFSARLIQAGSSLYGLFYRQPATVPTEAPTPAPALPEPSAPDKPNDVAAKMKA